MTIYLGDHAVFFVKFWEQQLIYTAFYIKVYKNVNIIQASSSVFSYLCGYLYCEIN